MTQLFVDGAWVEGEGSELRSIDPATGNTVWTGREASRAQVARAVIAARDAFAGWSRVPIEQRVKHLREFGVLVDAHRDELARVISLETGKPTWEALTEVASMVSKVDITIRAYRERTGTVERDLGAVRSVVRHRPHGVLAVLGPYNFPGHLPNGHIVPALLAGNTVAFKPSEHTAWCGVEVMRLWDRAGLPRGAVNLIQGAKETGVALVEHSQIDGLLFTGSAAAGHTLHRHFAGRPEMILALEMGGNNALVVDAITNVDAAIFTILQSSYVTAGQRCTCARRLFVPRGSIGQALVDRLLDAIGKLRVGPFDDPEPPFMGPVISEEAADALLAAQARIASQGGRPLAQMRKLKDGTGLVSPALIDVTGVQNLPDEEHFGPLLQLIYYDEFDEALQGANATRFGLAAGLIGGNRARWEAFVRVIRAGVVNWNRPLTGASSAAPFGGVGASGNHRPSAYYAADYCAHPVASLEQEVLALPETLPPGMTL
jgi:succinylglutamic semialdehyde dehydrogenase